MRHGASLRVLYKDYRGLAELCVLFNTALTLASASGCQWRPTHSTVNDSHILLRPCGRIFFYLFTECCYAVLPSACWPGVCLFACVLVSVSMCVCVHICMSCCRWRFLIGGLKQTGVTLIGRWGPCGCSKIQDDSYLGAVLSCPSSQRTLCCVVCSVFVWERAQYLVLALNFHFMLRGQVFVCRDEKIIILLYY